MTVINVDIEPAQLLRRFDRYEKRLAYSVVNAIRKTLLHAQRELQPHVRGKFVIRKPKLFFGTPERPGGLAGKIEVFPSVRQSRPYGEIAVGTKLSTSKGGPVLFPLFESGGERKPVTPGATHVAAPLLGRPARPSIAAGVPPAFTIAGLKFRAFRGGKLQKRSNKTNDTVFGEFGRLRLDRTTERAVQWKGLQRTYIVSGAGIFQRIGPDREDTRMIYKFLKPFALDDRLDFVATVTRVANTWFREYLEREIIDTLKFAKPAALARAAA